MEDDHRDDDVIWTEMLGRSTRPRRDSHARKHHRERGERGSKNPAHRSTRYKEKFHLLRDKYDRILTLREAYARDLDAAVEKIEKIQAENDLLLDAIYTSAPELMQLVSPTLSHRPPPHAHAPSHSRSHSHSNSHAHAHSSQPHPHQHGPISTYDPPPPPPHASTRSPNNHSNANAPTREPEQERDPEQHDSEIEAGNAVFRGSPRNTTTGNGTSGASSNGHTRRASTASVTTNGLANGNGVAATAPSRSRGTELGPKAEEDGI